MQTPAELVDKYRFYLKKYSADITELIGSDTKMMTLIYASDRDLEPLSLALRNMIDGLVFDLHD